MEEQFSIETLAAELEETKRKLAEAEDAIEAIRTGQVDALVLHTDKTPELFTLQSADLAYRIFIEKMNEGALTLSEDGIILFANAAFSEMTGKPLAQTLGNPFLQFLIPDDHERFTTLFAGKEQTEFKSEFTIAGTAEKIPVQLSVLPLDVDGNKTVSVLLTDLSAQKLAQTQLEEYNRELEESNNDLQQFASVASHDLQEPLRKLRIFTGLLKDEAADRLQPGEIIYLNKISASAERMKVLVMDILSYSRLSSKESAFAEVDLNALLSDILDDFEFLIRDKTVTVSVSKLPVVNGNKGQLRQMLQNLLSNAFKFTVPERQPMITISATDGDNSPRGKKEKLFTGISIKDNGIGFDEKFASNIFNLFERLHSKDKFEGTGIGLSIARKIAEKHGGYITAHSKPGVETEFCVFLPTANIISL